MAQALKISTGPGVKDQDYWNRFFERDEEGPGEEDDDAQVQEIGYLSVQEDSGFHRISDVRRFE